MFIISIIIIIVLSLTFFYVYTRFILEQRSKLIFTLPPAVLFIVGVYFRKPIIYLVENNLGFSLKDKLIFQEYPFWVGLTILLMAPIIEELLKGIWLFVIPKTRKSFFTSPIKILELGAVTGVGFGTMEAIWLAFHAKNLLSSFSTFFWFNFISERISAILGHTILTTILLFNVYLYFINKREKIVGWNIGYLKAIALHTFINISVMWYYMKDSHWYMIYIFIINFLIAFLVLIFCWGHIYNYVKEKVQLNDYIEDNQNIKAINK